MKQAFLLSSTLIPAHFKHTWYSDEAAAVISLLTLAKQAQARIG